MKTRKFQKDEAWTDLCEGCKSGYVPKEYKVCDMCLLSSLNLVGFFDSCDQIGLGPRMYEEEDVLKVLRHLRGEIYVEF